MRTIEYRAKKFLEDMKNHTDSQNLERLTCLMEDIHNLALEQELSCWEMYERAIENDWKILEDAMKDRYDAN